MRLFVAIDLSDAQRAEADRAARAMQRALEKARASDALRWVAPDAMHLTVCFIGHVDDEVGRRVQAALAAPLRCQPFTLALGAPGTFPGGGLPRVIWLGLSRGAEGARAVHEEIERLLEPFEFENEDREYRAHLTLGRVREIRRPAAERLRQALARLQIDPLPATVDHTALYRSHLSPKGPRYERLVDIHLTRSS